MAEQVPLIQKNQIIDLQSNSMDWFLHYRDLRHERVKLDLLWESTKLHVHYKPCWKGCDSGFYVFHSTKIKTAKYESFKLFK